MSVKLDQFKRTIDPIAQGNGGANIAALGFALTTGMAFPHPSGAVVLVRRRLYPVPEDWQVCGMALPTDAEISNWAGFGKEVGMGFQYAAYHANSAGFMSAHCEPVRVDFDDAGNRIDPPLPMFPINLVAIGLAGGKFRIVWEYDPTGQGAPPTDFQVFAGADAGSIDYGTPLVDANTSLNYVLAGPQRRYEFETAALVDGDPYSFGVRARNASGAAEKNTIATPVKTARATQPLVLTPIAAVQRSLT